MNQLAIFVGAVVTTVWASAVFVAFFTGAWPPVEIHGLMAMVVGAFFGKKAFDTLKDGVS